MPRQIGVSVENSFTKALITEATGLNFPENACTETFDCVFDKTGEVSRRLGIQLEDGLEQNAIESLADSALTEFLWKSVSLSGERTFFVMQRGSIISFWAIDDEGLIAPNLHEFYYNLNIGKQTSSPSVADVHASFAAGNGSLYIAHPYCTPVRIEYDEDTDTFEWNYINLQIRDVAGISNSPANDGDPFSTETISSSLRPTTLSGNILYNLLNQGWDAVPNFRLNKHVYGANTPLLKVWRKGVFNFPNNAGGAFNVWQAKHALGRNDWPSEADIWSVYKRPITPILDEDGNPTDPNVPDEGFALDATDDENLGSSPAPKGFYLYDAFNVDRWATLQGSQTLYLFPEAFNGLTPVQPETSGYARPSQIAFYAGRVWYAGVDAKRYNTRIYFSWIVENNLHAEKCYQRNDPTAADGPSTDLLPSDGGVVVIPDMARVIKLVPYGNSLLVFATNGIWQIAGSAQGAGFNATDYGVVKIASVGAISFLNFVDADGTPLWWNSDGIYSLRPTDSGMAQAVSLTNTTIQRFYDDIPVASRRFAKGVFNLGTKTIQWLYRSTAPTTVAERYHYDRILNLDLNTGSMYPWTISDSCLYVAGITVLNGYGGAATQVAVTDDDVIVTEGGETVTVAETVLADITPRFKYVVHNECEDTDPGDEDTAASLTYNRNFLGNNTNADLGTNIPLDAGINSVIVGEDGEFYVPTGTDSTLGETFNQRTTMQRFDGVGTVVNYPIEQFTLDMQGTVGISNAGGTFASRAMTAVPFTQYFYMSASGQVGGDFYLVFGLYKINAAGAIEYANVAQAFRAHFSIAFSAGHAFAVDYESFDAEDPLDRTLLICSGASSTNPFIIRLPSVNDFIATSGNVGEYTDIHTGFTASNFFDLSGDTYNSESSNDVFFLPTPSGALICRYVDWATCKAHIDNNNPAAQSPLIDGFAATYPTGFIMASPITGASWSVINPSFKDVNGNQLIPFADVLLDRDETDPGFAAGDYLNDWYSPTHQYDEDNNVHYLVWTRRYRPTEENQTSIGTYRKVLVQEWHPLSQLATSDADASGGPYDTVDDLGSSSGDRFGSYPRFVMTFFDTDFNEVYMYSVYDASSPGTSTNLALAKFGDFVPATVAEVPQTQLAFAEFTNPDFIDWADVTVGVDYTSYFISGYKLRGEALRKFQSNYWQVYTRNEDPSTFDVYGRWDYANSGNTGRWNSVQRVTMDDTRYSYQTRRLKMRGHGKALQFKVSSAPGEPFNIVGWSIYESTNAAP